MPGTPLYPKDMATEWMNLKKQVKGVFTSANSKPAFTKIAAGILNVFTSLVVQAGATITAKYQSGVDGIYFGELVFGPDEAEGMIIKDNDGNYSFVTFSRTSDGYGYTAIFDKTGNIIVSSDADSNFGLGRPWIPHTFVNTAELTSPPAERITGGTVDVSVVAALSPVQHPRVRMEAYVYIGTVGASCNYKVKDVFNGTTLLDATSTGGFVGHDFDVPGFDFGNNVYLDITVRRSAGAGNVGITVLSLLGRQS